MRVTDVDKAIKAAGIDIIGVAYGNGNWRIDFKPNETQQNQDAAWAIINGADWSDLPEPNNDAFQRSIFADANIPGAVKVQLYALFPVLDKVIREPAVLQPAWLQIKTYAGIPAEVITIVEGYAATYNVPLVAN